MAMLTTCAVGPDFRIPDPPPVTSYLPKIMFSGLPGGDRIAGQKVVHGADIPARWWELFHSRQLNQLIEDGITRNAELEAAEAAIRVAQANALAQRGALFPTFVGNFNSSRQLTPNQTLTTNAATGADTYSLHTAQVTVAYVADVFGGTRRQIESLDAVVDVQTFQREGVYLTLTANIALAAKGILTGSADWPMIACAPNWGASIDRAYQADRANGANLLTITGGHTVDALCYCLGEFRELAAFVVSQRDRIPLEGTGEIVAKTSPDQLVVNGIVGNGAVASFQVRGGMARGTDFLFEIHGEEGDLVLTATSRTSMQRQELNLQGARGKGTALADLPVPGKYRWVPEGVPPGSPYNVAQLYMKLAEGIREGRPVSPGFDGAVTRHRLLDAILRASEMGLKQGA